MSESEGAGSPAQPKAETPQAGLFGRVFHHPNFNVVCGLVTILSLFVTFYFWWEGKRTRELTYYISPNRTPIVQKGGLDNFSVLYNGTSITSALSSVDIQIWNNGKQPILHDEIRQPIIIKTPSNEIIYRVIDKTTSPLPQAFYIAKVPIQISNSVPITNYMFSEMNIDWRSLEYGEGIKIQLVYGGDVNLPILIGGAISEQGPIRQYAFSSKNRTSIGVVVICAIPILGLMFLNFKYGAKVGDRLADNVKPRFVSMTVRIILVVFFSFSPMFLYIYLTRLFASSPPPFGF